MFKAEKIENEFFMLKIFLKTDFACTFAVKEKMMYAMDVLHLHGFSTFNVPHLKIFVPHSKLE